MSNATLKFLRTVALSIVLVFLLNVFIVNAQAADAVPDLLARINRERLARGLVPYALNADLTAAAQAHANELAKTGKMRTPDEGHRSADGSTVFERVARTNYGAYSWGRRLGENWAHYRDTATAFSEWMASTPHRNNILHALYREVGIGVAPSALGGFIFIVDFGAQPNVLPIFINDGATETKTPDITILLNDELVAPTGDNGNAIGHPTQIQIAATADFANAKWQPYASKTDWTLPAIPGKQTVYVKYRDAKGHTATAFDSIGLNIATTPLATATRTNTVIPRPSLTLTATRTPTATETTAPTREATPTQAPTATIASTVTITPTSTATPAATAMATAPFDPGSLALGTLGLVTIVLVLISFAKENFFR